jgi:hypothetical protein
MHFTSYHFQYERKQQIAASYERKTA